MMTVGHLADVKRRLQFAATHQWWMPTVAVDRYVGDVSDLLHEVERLRREQLPSLADGVAAYYASGQADIDRGEDHIERSRP